VSGSGISWAICKSAPRSRQITTPASYHSVFTGRKPILPPNQQEKTLHTSPKRCYPHHLHTVSLSENFHRKFTHNFSLILLTCKLTRNRSTQKHDFSGDDTQYRVDDVNIESKHYIYYIRLMAAFPGQPG